MPSDSTVTPKLAVPLGLGNETTAVPTGGGPDQTSLPWSGSTERSIVACLLLVTSLAVACEAPAPPGASHHDAGLPATPASLGGSEKERATVDVLRRLDKLRTDNFNPGIDLPRRPEPPALDPNKTAFAASEATKTYENQVKEYDGQVVRVRRALDKYVKDFERDWGAVVVDEQQQAGKKQSALTSAAQSAGWLPSGATCHVLDIEGRCEPVCLSFLNDTGLREVAMRACAVAEREGFSPSSPYTPYRAQACKAEFSCRAAPKLENATPGLQYDAPNFRITFSKHYVGKTAAADAASFYERVRAFKPNAEVEFGRIRRWRFVTEISEGWSLDASPDDGWPLPAETKVQ